MGLLAEGDMLLYCISAQPVYEQPYLECLRQDVVLDATLALSHPGVLTVVLRPEATRQAADQLATCLRELPGPPLTVSINSVER